jgi:glycosyltransferase involved in cell wall biosynthesis
VSGARLPRVAFLIQSLGVGGAEAQLVELAVGLEDRGFDVSVLAMYPGGRLERELQKRSGFDYVMLGKRSRSDLVGFGARLLGEIRRRRPDIIYGFMPVANHLALLAGRLTGAKVVWGLRSAFVDFRHYDRASSILFRTGRMLSRLPDLTIVNSFAGRDYHQRVGYAASRMIVIPNGIDTSRFRPDPAASRRMRQQWGVVGDVPLVGIVGRLEPMKDHPTFLDAAAVVAAKTDAHFVCIGSGPAEYVEQMQKRAASAGLGARVHWVGVCDDMPAAYAALDVLVSASTGEGFSNVVGEAMSCGVRCVVTDAGDSARLVGTTGVVVPVGDSQQMARGVITVLDGGGTALGDPRERMLNEYGRERMIAATESALLDLHSAS